MASSGSKLQDKELAASYGWALAFLNSVPELKKLFGKAVKKQYTPERFIGELQATKWYQGTAEPQRRYQVLRTAYPSDYVSKVSQIMSSLADQYSQMTGETLAVKPPKIVKGKIVNGSGTLAHIADMSLKLGWNEAQIRDNLFKSVNWRDRVAKRAIGGQSAGNLQALRQQAAAYGVQPSENWFGDVLGRIAVGNNTIEGGIESLKNSAKQRYAHYAQDIDAGRTIDDIADNYRQSMARVLEINPNSIDVFDSQIQTALQGSLSSDGKRSAMTIGDFERRLRSDNRWQYTDNAREQIVGGTASLLKSFGLSV